MTTEEKNKMVRRLNRIIGAMNWMLGVAGLDAAETAVLADARDDARLTLRDLQKDGAA